LLRSLKKVFLLIDAFTAEVPEWTLADLARHVDMPKPTVHHIMTTLLEGGWIDRHAESKKFRLGVRLWEKGSLAIRQMGLREIARPYVEALVQKCGETVRLGILDTADPGWVIYIDRVEGRQTVRADNAGTVRAPSYCVATGKAMLAHNPEIIDRVFARQMRGYTEHTLTKPAELDRDLALTRRRGYSLNRSEFHGEVVGIAAPIHNHEGRVVAAVGISAPAYRLGADVIKRIAPVVVATAGEISRSAGFVSQGGSNGTFTQGPVRRVGNGRGDSAAAKRGSAGVPEPADRSARGVRARGRQ
jgi:DNA-binding IclR family transcriptional regulator